MSIVEVTKTSFTAGELDPHLLGRLDLKAVEDGARRLRNVIVEPTGGVRRRPGLAHVANVAGARRLVSFERSSGAVLLAFAPQLVHVIDGGVIVDQVVTPFTAAALDGLSMARWGDRLLVTQPRTRPQEIVAIDADSWASREWKWEAAAEASGYAATSQPFAKFARPETILEIKGSSVDGDGDIRVGSTVELTVVGEDYFTAAHLGLVLRITVVEAADVGTTSRYVDIELDPIPGQTRSARGTIRGKLRNNHRTRRWQEQAFSDLRGWPASLAVFQDRLVIGGSRDLPDRIWISRTGQPFDMGLGTGLDDEGIAFRLGAERIHEIRSLLAGRHLQVFTSCGEWTIRGDPLTPSSVQVELQTRVGSWTQRRLAPVDVDGATLFVGAGGRDLREYLFADSEQAYQAADIALLARHLMLDPVDLAFDGARRLFMVVRGDGAMATVTIDRNSNVAAWSLQSGAAAFVAAVVHRGVTHFLVELDGGVHLARLDDAAAMDLGLVRTAITPTTSWTGLDRFNGREVLAVAGDGTVARATVTAGALTLSAPTTGITVGLPFTSEVEPGPAAVPAGRGIGQDRIYRPVRVVFRVLETGALRADVGDGLRPLLNGGAATADLPVRALGWRRGVTASAWRVAQDDPKPLTLLSVTTELRMND